MKSAEQWAAEIDECGQTKSKVEAIREEMRQACAGAVPLRAILDWWMCSDPWPGGDQDGIKKWLDVQCHRQGYDNWVTAFHEMPKAAME